MTWVSVRAGSDHLQQYAKKNPTEALAELVWNCLDAEATVVDVEIETSSLGPDDELPHITRIVVSDNGHGITEEKAKEAFPSLGDSWKKGLNGRTLNDLRPLHGSQGRGRFFAYSLGHGVHWSSTARAENGFTRIEIDGDQNRINGFSIGLPVQASEPTGTTLTIAVEQGRSLNGLLKDDVPVQLAARFAAHLLGNPDITIRLNGVKVDPRPIMERDPIEVPLDDVPIPALGGHEVPRMKIVDWSDAVREAPGVLLCRENGTSLVELPRTAPPGSVRSTGFLCWSAWAQTGIDLLVSQLEYPAVVEAGVQRLAEHVHDRVAGLTATIVATLKDEGSYPYPEHIDDPLRDAERQVFDLLAVAARRPLKLGNKQVRAMTARLLHVALQERPESLDVILDKALDLSPGERDELAQMLRYSTLGSIIAGAAEVSRRLDLLLALRHLIYGPEVSKEMREVDQLHPLVRDNVWLFGEPWRLTASEAGLSTVLRAVLGKDKVLDTDLVNNGLQEQHRGRVDLVLERALDGPNDQLNRLVVELKRPSVGLGETELAQVRKYGRALSESPGIGPSRWTFWLVGSTTKEEIAGELEQQDREWGHVSKAPKYDIFVTTWARLIDRAERSLSFYREQLTYNASQEDALKRVRQRHHELLPPDGEGPVEPS